MPCFYFHVRQGQVTVIDQKGAHLSDAAHAKAEAKQRALEVVRRDDRANGGKIIVDDEWETVFELAF